ncbi:MAG: hypothetical protein WDM90_20010 [Ferruginibacter sp.]
MEKTKLLAIVILGLALFYTCNLFAQQDCIIRNFNASNGIMQNSITGMSFDDAGYLWMGTQNGLIRYDGTNFKNFLLDTSNKSTNLSNIVINLSVCLKEKTILIRTSDALVHTVKEGRPVLYSDAVKNTAYGYELRGHFSSLKMFDKFNLPFKELAFKQGWYSLRREVLPLNESDFIVLGGNNKELLYYKDGVKQAIIHLDDNFKMFLKCGSQNLLVDAKDQFYLFDDATTKFKEIAIEKSIFKKATAGIEKPIYFWDTFNDQSYCYFNDIFYLLKVDQINRTIQLTPRFSMSKNGHFFTGIIYDSINSVYFLTTLTEGLFQVKLKLIQTFNLNKKISPDKDVNNTINYSTLKTSDSTVLTTTGFEFIASAKGITVNQKGNIFGNREAIAKLGDTAILTISNEKLFYYSRSDGFIQPKIFNPSFNKGNYFISLLQTEGDSIWVGTDGGIYNLKGKEIKTLLEFNVREGEVSSGPKLFYRLDKNTAFFSNDFGLFKINTAPPYTVQAISEMKDKQVRYIDKYNDMLVLSVYKEGIYIYKDNHFYKVPLEYGKPGLSLCHSTYIDKKGEVWIPTDKGLFRSSMASLIEAALKPGIKPFYYYYGINDGIANTEFNGRGSPPFATLANGQLFYPSMGGIVTFNPNEVHDEILKAPILIDKISVDNNEIVAGVKDSFDLAASFNYLDIDFTVANFGEPENLVIESNLG